jgi:DNA-binding response OmpR family regulator
VRPRACIAIARWRARGPHGVQACGVDRARILIVEDDAALARALDDELSDACVTIVVGTGRAALDVIASEPVDLVVLDLNLPDMDGLDVARALSADGAQVDVLMLTARADVASRVAGLYAGAVDYLAKPFDMDELLARVHAQLRRRGEAATLTWGPLEVSTHVQRCTVGGTTVALSASELRLLTLLMNRQGRVHARPALEHTLYGERPPTSNAVEVLVSRLRGRLAEHGLERVIETVRGLGYVVRPYRS